MRHIRIILVAMAGILFVLLPTARADSLQLKNGNFVQGKYLGGTDRAVQFEVNGRIRLYGVDEILSISFAAASADGGIPSDNADSKPSSDSVSNSTAKDNSGLRTALWNQKNPRKGRGQQSTWEQQPFSSRADLRVAPPAASPASSRAVVAANPCSKAQVATIPTRSVRILPQRFPVLSE